VARIVIAMETHFEGTGAASRTSDIRASRNLVDVDVAPPTTDRNRLTGAFRFILAIPHLILVGGPATFVTFWMRGDESGTHWGAGLGALGAAAAVVTIIAWFAIVFTGRHPRGLWDLAAFYMRWRVRAVSYVTLLTDEYPPFGDEDYPAKLSLTYPEGDRDRLTVAFRPVLAIPHFVVLWVLGVAWAVVTLIGWISILVSRRYPEGLYRFAVGVLRWGARVETYLLLLRDEYPPFSLE
jgi:hypothetical protein